MHTITHARTIPFPEKIKTKIDRKDEIGLFDYTYKYLWASSPPEVKDPISAASSDNGIKGINSIKSPATRFLWSFAYSNNKINNKMPS